MRRTALLVLLVAAVGVAAAGCGGEESESAAPQTVEGTTSETTTTETTSTETTETTETGTTGTETTGTETTETTTTETTPAEGDPAAGKQVFLGAPACGGCHTLSDAGTSGNVGPNLDDAKPPYDLVVDRVTNGQGGMPSFKGTLSDQQIQDVAAYVSSVAGK